ncbi:hepcidin-like [Brachyistius frenatus]|uniref:hepcidin-like n=1 Tax=Brachyistius frenatus TaxID=100188 RepID=UPI0037E84D70
MKTFSVAVAVAVVLTFICIQESSAVPLTEQEQGVEVPVAFIDSSAATEGTSVDSWKTLSNTRETKGIKCRFCCGCCKMNGCGVCCRF